jgi:site-specific recombinase XerD
MFACGLRSSEARSLTAEQVVQGKSCLIITGKGGKTRIVPVPDPDLWQEITTRAETNGWTGPLWRNGKGQPWTDLRGSLKSAAKRAGWPARMYAHLLRHAYGTELVSGGAATLRDVQVLMGHSTSQVTEIYTHLSHQRLTEVAKSLFTGGVNKK